MTKVPLEGAADHKELIEALDRFSAKTDMLLRNNTNSSRITISAGGVGVWAAVTACIAMVALNLALLFQISGHDRKIERMQDHLNAIYMMAPHLKPEKEGK